MHKSIFTNIYECSGYAGVLLKCNMEVLRRNDPDYSEMCTFGKNKLEPSCMHSFKPISEKGFDLYPFGDILFHMRVQSLYASIWWKP